MKSTYYNNDAKYRFLNDAEIGKLSDKEKIEYQKKLKIYRDYNNTIDYAYNKGWLKDFKESILTAKIETFKKSNKRVLL